MTDYQNDQRLESTKKLLSKYGKLLILPFFQDFFSYVTYTEDRETAKQAVISLKDDLFTFTTPSKDGKAMIQYKYQGSGSASMSRVLHLSGNLTIDVNYPDGQKDVYDLRIASESQRNVKEIKKPSRGTVIVKILSSTIDSNPDFHILKEEDLVPFDVIVQKVLVLIKEKDSVA